MLYLLFSQQEATVVSLLSPLLLPFRQNCPRWSASPLLNARQRGYKESQRERLASRGQIMNIFNVQQKDCDPAVTGTFHITTFHMWGNNCVNESNAYYIFISLLPFFSGSCGLLFDGAKNHCNNPAFLLHKGNVLILAELCQYSHKTIIMYNNWVAGVYSNKAALYFYFR